MNYQKSTTYDGWPIIQNQDPKKLVGYGIGLLLLTGKLTGQNSKGDNFQLYQID